MPRRDFSLDSPAMFKSTLFFVAASALLFVACQPNRPPAPVAAPLTITMAKWDKENCLRDSMCATLHLAYPVLTGGTATTAAINDSIEAFVYLVTEADPNLPLPQALDSAALKMFTLLREDEAMRGS